MVRLSDGRWAVVMEHNPQHPCRPVVQIIPSPHTLSPNDLPPGEQIDLSQVSNDQLQIIKCDGEDVSELNFTLPRLYTQDCMASSFI